MACGLPIVSHREPLFSMRNGPTSQVYSGTDLVAENALLDVPSAICCFYMTYNDAVHRPAVCPKSLSVAFPSPYWDLMVGHFVPLRHLECNRTATVFDSAPVSVSVNKSSTMLPLEALLTLTGSEGTVSRQWRRPEHKSDAQTICGNLTDNGRPEKWAVRLQM